MILIKNHEKNSIQTICDDIESVGFVVLEQAFNSKLLSNMRQQLIQSQSNPNHFHQAGIGRANDYQLQTTVRGDHIMWLDRHNDELAEYFRWIAALQTALNQRFYLGLNEYECMYAHYPISASYQKHVDAFKGSLDKHNRRISTVLYLNEDWHTEDGGELLLYQEGQDEPFKRISPELGRLVIFLSEEFPHEVLPAKKPRFSLTGWFRT